MIDPCLRRYHFVARVDETFQYHPVDIINGNFKEIVYFSKDRSTQTWIFLNTYNPH